MLHRFAQSKNHFGNAMAQFAVMIDFCKAEIFERQVTDAVQRRIDICRAGAHVVEERAELIFCHPIKW
jgi:hypothetical protein